MFQCIPQTEDYMCSGANTVRQNVYMQLKKMCPFFPQNIEQFSPVDKAVFTYFLMYTAQLFGFQNKDLYVHLVGDIEDEEYDVDDEWYEQYLLKYFESGNAKAEKWFEQRKHIWKILQLEPPKKWKPSNLFNSPSTIILQTLRREHPPESMSIDSPPEVQRTVQRRLDFNDIASDGDEADSDPEEIFTN